jgi:hypothetical protein
MGLTTATWPPRRAIAGVYARLHGPRLGAEIESPPDRISVMIPYFFRKCARLRRNARRLRSEPRGTPTQTSMYHLFVANRSAVLSIGSDFRSELEAVLAVRRGSAGAPRIDEIGDAVWLAFPEG